MLAVQDHYEPFLSIDAQDVVVRHLVARAQTPVDDLEGLGRHRVPEYVRVAPGVAAEAPGYPRGRTDRVPAKQPLAQRRETGGRRGAVQRLEARSDGGRSSPSLFAPLPAPSDAARTVPARALASFLL